MARFHRLGPVSTREAVVCWLRLVAGDAELAPYLAGVDQRRFVEQLAGLLTMALHTPCTCGGHGDLAGAWRSLGLTEAHHRRVADYLGGVLWALDVPTEPANAAKRSITGET